MIIIEKPILNKPTAKLKRVAAYARVSTGKDSMLHSLSTQIEYYSKLIKENPKWDFVEIFYDEGISGTKTDRPGFQRMLESCRNDEIDIIITKSITRFARNTVFFLETLRELKTLGVTVIFEKENINTSTADGEFIMTLLSAYAQAEAQSVSENQIWRIRKGFAKGIPNTCKVYGYRYEDGHFVIVPEEAAIVRQIFADYLSGMGKTLIAKKLTKKKIPTKYDCKIWAPATIYHILRNDAYIGNLLLQKTYHENFMSKKRMENHGELRMYRVTNAHEPILDKETFYAVQEEIKRRADAVHGDKTGTRRYALSGFIRCGNCGNNYRHKITAHGTKYQKHVWVCPTYIQYGKEYCASHRIPENIIIAKICEALSLDNLENIDLRNYLQEIIVPRHQLLRFVFLDGSTKDIAWKYPSRSKSWTPEMKELARQRTIMNNAAKKDVNRKDASCKVDAANKSKNQKKEQIEEREMIVWK